MKKFFAVMIFMLMIAAQTSAMDLKLNRDVDWHVGLGSGQKLQIKGYSRLDGNFSKGVAVFGDKLYLHFDATLFEEIRTKRKTFEQIEPLDTRDVQKNHQMAWDYYLQDFFATGDKIIFSYEQWESKKICRLVYTWDETAQWFTLEVIH